MQIYVHSTHQEDPELIEVEAAATIREIVTIRPEVEAEGVWIVDQDDELDLQITFEAAGIGHRHHVHRGRCRKVDARVRYGGDIRGREFAPSATVGRIFDWATGEDGFDLAPDQRAKHVLALPNADHFLAKSVHIGSLVTAESCEVVLDLDAKVRFEG